MKSKMILTIGLLAIVLGIATTGIAIKSVQAVTPDPEAIKTASETGYCQCSQTDFSGDN